MGPAALHRDGGIDLWQGGSEALAAIDAKHVEAFANETATIKAREETFPFSSTLARRQMEVDHLLLAIGPDA
jgi:hypothetical protein